MRGKSGAILLVVAAISVAAGSGRKPAREPGVNVSLRPLLASEVMGILNRFPEMVPSDLTAQKNDTNYLVRVYGLVEVSVPLLGQAFPAARFYMGRDFHRKPSGSYLMAIAGDRRYVMPGGFNQLLLGNGLEVTDRNIVELAKAFVIVAVAERDSVSQVTFKEAKRTKQVISGISYDAWLKVKIGDQMEEWYFDTKYGQFGVISRGNAKGLIKQYDPVDGRPRGERGRLD